MLGAFLAPSANIKRRGAPDQVNRKLQQLVKTHKNQKLNGVKTYE